MLYKPIIENQVKINNIFFPTSIMIKLTNRCNFKCSFCSQGESSNRDIDIRIVKKVLEEAKLYGVTEIIYSGGEPLLYKNFREVISYGHKLGLFQTVVTNGFFIDKYIEDIIGNISQIGISIHGDEETHDLITGFPGNYSRIVKNIEYLNCNNFSPKITLNFTITESNIHTIHEVMAFAKTNNCSLSVARLNRVGNSINNNKIKETIDKFFNSELVDYDINVSNVIPLCQINFNKRHLCHSCSAGIASVCVDADLKVKICGSSSKIMGSLEKNILYEIWNNEDFLKFRSLNWLPNLCKNCRDFVKCLGGCKAEKYESIYSDSTDCLLGSSIEDF